MGDNGFLGGVGDFISGAFDSAKGVFDRVVDFELGNRELALAQQQKKQAAAENIAAKPATSFAQPGGPLTLQGILPIAIIGGVALIGVALVLRN